VQGRSVYRVLQILVWISRLLCSIMVSILWFYPDHEALLWLSNNKTFFLMMALIEILSLTGSAIVLRIYQPPAVRLVDTSTHKSDEDRSGTPGPRSAILPAAVPENDLLAALSLSSKPVILSPHKPVFGQSSLKGSSPAINEEFNNEDMDWIPTNPASSSAFAGKAKLATETGTWLSPQRFFAPEKTTGLEGLLECAKIRDDPMVVDSPDARLRSSQEMLMQHVWQWRVTYVILAALVVSFLFAKEMPWSSQTKS